MGVYYFAGKTLTKLTANITDYFKSNPTLKRLSPANKRLTLVFIGYSYSFAPPRGIFSIISNFETIKDGICRAEALDHFIHEESHEIRPNDDSLGIVFPFGMWTSINKKEIEDLYKMVLDKKPPNALIGMAHKIIINAADHSASKQTIGKQMSSIILPRIRINPVQTSYHTNVNSYENYGVPYLFATSSATTVIGGSTLTSFGEGGDKDRKFSAIPKVKMDRPCPCGSGKRYKYCHGVNI